MSRGPDLLRRKRAPELRGQRCLLFEPGRLPVRLLGRRVRGPVQRRWRLLGPAILRGWFLRARRLRPGDDVLRRERAPAVPGQRLRVHALGLVPWELLQRDVRGSVRRKWRLRTSRVLLRRGLPAGSVRPRPALLRRERAPAMRRRRFDVELGRLVPVWMFQRRLHRAVQRQRRLRRGSLLPGWCLPAGSVRPGSAVLRWQRASAVLCRREHVDVDRGLQQRLLALRLHR